MLVFLLLSAFSFAQNCPLDDSEPAMTAKTLIVCGFEDREVPKRVGKRAFSDFAVYQLPSTKIFQSEESETYWVGVLPDKGLELEELWFFEDKPVAGLRREVTCTSSECKVSEPKCVYKGKYKFPKALATFTKQASVKDNGEELLDQIFAQALQKDKAAVSFYATAPQGMSPELTEVYEQNRKKLAICK